VQKYLLTLNIYLTSIPVKRYRTLNDFDVEMVNPVEPPPSEGIDDEVVFLFEEANGPWEDDRKSSESDEECVDKTKKNYLPHDSSPGSPPPGSAKIVLKDLRVSMYTNNLLYKNPQKEKVDTKLVKSFFLW
jgi:hypothetical protein